MDSGLVVCKGLHYLQGKRYAAEKQLIIEKKRLEEIEALAGK